MAFFYEFQNKGLLVSSVMLIGRLRADAKALTVVKVYWCNRLTLRYITKAN